MKFSAGLAGGIFLVCFYLITQKTDECLAKPVESNEPAVNLVKYENSNIGVDGYNFSFETSDGVIRKETATVKNLGTDEEAISVEGSVTWVGPDGVQYTLNYLADENGFQPEGKHLPVAPET